MKFPISIKFLLISVLFSIGFSPIASATPEFIFEKINVAGFNYDAEASKEFSFDIGLVDLKASIPEQYPDVRSIGDKAVILPLKFMNDFNNIISYPVVNISSKHSCSIGYCSHDSYVKTNRLSASSKIGSIADFKYSEVARVATGIKHVPIA